MGPRLGFVRYHHDDRHHLAGPADRRRGRRRTPGDGPEHVQRRERAALDGPGLRRAHRRTEGQGPRPYRPVRGRSGRRRGGGAAGGRFGRPHSNRRAGCLPAQSGQRDVPRGVARRRCAFVPGVPRPPRQRGNPAASGSVRAESGQDTTSDVEGGRGSRTRRGPTPTASSSPRHVQDPGHRRPTPGPTPRCRRGRRRSERSRPLPSGPGGSLQVDGGAELRETGPVRLERCPRPRRPGRRRRPGDGRGHGFPHGRPGSAGRPLRTGARGHVGSHPPLTRTRRAAARPGPRPAPGPVPGTERRRPPCLYRHPVRPQPRRERKQRRGRLGKGENLGARALLRTDCQPGRRVGPGRGREGRPGLHLPRLLLRSRRPHR